MKFGEGRRKTSVQSVCQSVAVVWGVAVVWVVPVVRIVQVVQTVRARNKLGHGEDFGFYEGDFRRREVVLFVKLLVELGDGFCPINVRGWGEILKWDI